MAEAFNTDVNSLENELIALILDGLISARIDSHAKIMYARQIDQRGAVFKKAIEIGDAYVLRTKVTSFDTSYGRITSIKLGCIDEGSVTQQQHICNACV
jgi:hypothetical protein